ncbi:zinc finger MYM-type protein 1-like [Scomber scombrus]|uniref:Zinc finger MYM-type protein 1-like n=1 Tax=Scomber scombrus TaxID=13677 RepID=A0AAV1NQW2_SCOSC
MCQVPTHLKQYMVESTVGQQQQDRGNEMNATFSEQKSQLVEEKCAFDADSPPFLDIQKVKSLLEITNTVEFSIAPHFYILKWLALKTNGPLLPSCSTILGLLTVLPFLRRKR